MRNLIKNQSLLIIIGLWWLIYTVLFVKGFNNLHVLNIIGLPALIFIPGYLTLILFKLTKLALWAKISIAVAFSLLEFMLLGLIANAVLPYFGIARPLDKQYVFIGFNAVIGLLYVISWVFSLKNKITNSINTKLISPRDIILMLIPVLFVPISIFGAISLNNGGSNIFTLILLPCIGIYLILLLINIDSVNENMIQIGLFFVSLSMLFMTSLRGWFITGHDIQIEYHVFENVKTYGLWSITTYLDAYNACVSITILPAILSNLLAMPDQYIYKILFQIIFALCPGIAFLISRQWFNRKTSLLSAIYFIAFPTFFEDMPFLIRQEVAFLYFSLMLYIIFQEKVNLAKRRIMFLLFGIGAILSHYSTTYTILFIFGISSVIMLIWYLLSKRIKRISILKNSSVSLFSVYHIRITVILTFLLFGLTYLWTFRITHTGGNLLTVSNKIISASKEGFIGKNRAIEATSFFTFKKPDQTAEMLSYIKSEVDPVRASASKGEYFEDAIFTNYSFEIVHSEHLPLTGLGIFFTNHGINVAFLIPLLGQILAKFMEFAVLIGIIYVLFIKISSKTIDAEYYVISAVCLFFIALNIILPVVSTEYGVFRALQQTLFLLAPFMVIGTHVFGKVIVFSRKSMFFSGVLAILFFLYSTTLIPQLFGGNDPQLHLNNKGTYYESYLIRDTEASGISWLEQTVKKYMNTYNTYQPDIQVDKNSRNKIKALSTLGLSETIFPRLIRKEAYVFLNHTNVAKEKSAVKYNGDTLNYSFNAGFLDSSKNLIYNNGGVKIYR